jgi:hypothetical protein
MDDEKLKRLQELGRWSLDNESPPKGEIDLSVQYVQAALTYCRTCQAKRLHFIRAEKLLVCGACSLPCYVQGEFKW